MKSNCSLNSRICAETMVNSTNQARSLKKRFPGIKPKEEFVHLPHSAGI